MKYYKFKYKRFKWLPWCTLKACGHKLEHDKMTVFLSEGRGIYVIPNWVNYHCKLGEDWVVWNKSNIKEQTGQ